MKSKLAMFIFSRDQKRTAGAGLLEVRNGGVRLLKVGAAALLLAGCAQYAVVSEKRPRFLPVPPGTGPLARAEHSISTATKEQRTRPLVALGRCIEATETAAGELQRQPGNVAALRDYNFALSRVFEI